MRNALAAMAAIAVGLMSAATADASTLLWIEGESAARRNVHHNAWFESVDPTELSGGAQIANFSEPKDPDGWAEYDVTMPAAGSYQFWLRANPSSGILFAVNGSSWTKLDVELITKGDRAHQRTKGFTPRAQQRTNVAIDGTHDARTMTWYNVGSLRLPAGKNTIRFSLGGQQPSTKRFAALDCFVLSSAPFRPNYQFKPGEGTDCHVGLSQGGFLGLRAEEGFIFT